MAVSDPISDFLTVIRNASRAKHERIEVQASRMKANIAKLLKEEGYINSFRLVRSGNKNLLRVYLKYHEDRPVISGVKKVSKPGIRRYVTKTTIPRVLDGMGVAILSTSKGIVTGQQAQEMGVGGELVCTVW